ncbi:MAG: hypothetical protein KGL95_15820 [Patescibacteria group bacterium]|nr:hypothetical protein [Patescibacteria group bacterium]
MDIPAYISSSIEVWLPLITMSYIIIAVTLSNGRTYRFVKLFALFLIVSLSIASCVMYAILVEWKLGILFMIGDWLILVPFIMWHHYRTQTKYVIRRADTASFNSGVDLPV